MITIFLFSLLSMSTSAETLRTKVRTPLFGMGGKFSGVQLYLSPNTTVEVMNLSDVDVNGLVFAQLVFNDNFYIGYIKKSDLDWIISAESEINDIDPELKSKFDRALEQTSKEFRDEPTPLFQRFPDRSYGIEETDYDRFSTSACFKDLGFTPYVIGSSGYVDQLKRYEQCEKRRVIVNTLFGLFITIFIFIILRYRRSLRDKFRRMKARRETKVNHTTLNAMENLEKLKAEIETLHVLKNEGVINQTEFEIRMNKIKEKY